ncbi:MAG: T9SS type A sorting domain-containing protein, partial [Bacteroidota bacterium]
VFQWQENVENEYYNAGKAISVDASGNVYVLAEFEGHLEIGPNAYINYAYEDLILLAYENSGSLAWVQHFDGHDPMKAGGLDISPGGYLAVTGSFQGYMIVAGNQYQGTSTQHAFLSLFENSGQHFWSTFYGLAGSTFGEGVSISAGGYIYMTGYYDGKLQFGPYSLPNAVADAEGYVAMLDLNANVLRVDHIESAPGRYVHPLHLAGHPSFEMVTICGTGTSVLGFPPSIQTPYVFAEDAFTAKYGGGCIEGVWNGWKQAESNVFAASVEAESSMPLIDSEREGIVVYPNPFADRFSVDVSLPEASDLELFVFNPLGKLLVHRTSKAYPAGTHRFDIDEAAIQGSGMRIIKVRIGEKMYYQKLISER